jgi:hypothetical protein
MMPASMETRWSNCSKPSLILINVGLVKQK